MENGSLNAPEFVWAKGRQEEKNLHLIFSVVLENVEKPVLKLAAENMYQIWCFDRFVSFGPVRSAEGKARVELLELSDYVENGRIVVNVEVAGFHIKTFCHADDLPFFSAEITDGGALRATSGDFTCCLAQDVVQKVQKYSYQRTFLESRRMEADRREYLRSGCFPFPRLELEPVAGGALLGRGVGRFAYEDVTAERILDCGAVYRDETLPLFQDRSITQVDSGELDGWPSWEQEEVVSYEIDRLAYRSQAVDLRQIGAGQYVLYDFQQLHSGFIGIEAQVQQDCVFYLLWEEILADPEKKLLDYKRVWQFNAVKYRLKKGSYHCFSFEPYTARFVKLVVMEGALSDVKIQIKTQENPHFYRLKFRCADAQLEKIFQAARRSGAQNALDVLMDCPSRERGAWLADSSFAAKGEWLFTGENKTEYNHLENFAMMPRRDVVRENRLPMVVYPSATQNYSVYNWPMWMAYQLLEYRRRTGDGELVKKLADYLQVSLRYYARQETAEGFLQGGCLFDYSQYRERTKDLDRSGTVDIPLQMYYVQFLETMSQLYGGEGLLEKADRLRGLIEKHGKKGIFYGNYIKPNGAGGYECYPVLSEGAQWQAFYFGFATREKDGALLKYLLQYGTPASAGEETELVPVATFMTRIYKYDVLCRYGAFEAVLADMKQSLLWMAELTDTLHEHDELLSMSKTHGFTTIFAVQLARALAGFGYYARERDILYLYPSHGRVDCTVEFPTEKGAVCVRVRDGKRTVTVPDGTQVQEME